MILTRWLKIGSTHNLVFFISFRKIHGVIYFPFVNFQGRFKIRVKILVKVLGFKIGRIWYHRDLPIL